jgi:hypothetical protein
VTFFRRGFFPLLLWVVVLVRQMPAQAQNNFGEYGPGGPIDSNSASTGDSSNSSASNASGNSSASSEEGYIPDQPLFTDWPVLVIPGVADLGELSGTGAVVGAGVSGGYGQISDSELGNPSGFISVAQPYVGLFHAGYRDKVLAEYSPTIDLFNKNAYDGAVLQAGGIRGFDDLTRRLRWVFSGYTTYGTEYVRELQGLAIGEYPNWLTFLAPSETVFAASVSTGLHWRVKPKQELSVNVGDSYSSIRAGSPEDGAHYNADTVRGQFTDYFDRQSSWWAYGQASRYSDQPGCTRVGWGGGLAWNITSSTGFSLEGGPEYGDGTCVVRWTGNFGGSLSHRFTPGTVFYLSAIRDLVEPYLLDSRWTDIFSAKLWQRTSRNTSIAAGAAYERSSDLPGQTIARYRATLLFTEFHWRLSESLSLASGYRYFKRDFSSPGFEGHDSWVFCSIVWHPMGRGTRR